MADDIVIRAERLGKKYVIGHEARRERYVALRDVIARSARSAMHKAADMAKGRIVVPGDEMEEFWALKDINFEVKRGEVLGIIGRNGAGKSTLLKILSRITEPTEGRVTIKGRVASLLEVGTGFHPELTGRENIYLNGAVLGMMRAEIKRKFDEIVAFSEVEKFLDTPVKRYSSGMYVRLAFAVAAHLEPEILIVDEVLAVGDAEFQKKCLGKMQDVAGHGRTVLFVSHNMAAVQALCRSVITIDKGRILDNSLFVSETISHFLSRLQSSVTQNISERTDRTGSGNLRLVGIQSRTVTGESTEYYPCGADGLIELTIEAKRPQKDVLIALGIDTNSGIRITQLSTQMTGNTLSFPIEGLYRVSIKLDKIPLVPGVYYISVYIGSQLETIDWLENAASFTVEAGRYYKSGTLPSPGKAAFLVEHEFSQAIPQS